MSSEYDVKEAVLKKYHTMATQLFARFDKAQIKQLLRNNNTRASALSKLASSVIIQKRGKILFEHRETLSYNTSQILYMNQEETWMMPIIRTIQGE